MGSLEKDSDLTETSPAGQPEEMGASSEGTEETEPTENAEATQGDKF